MAWNEPGGKNPWGGRNGNQGPPDLDEILRKAQQRLAGLFGGKRPRNGETASRGPEGLGSPAGLGGLMLLAVLAFGAYDSFHVVEPAERGVVLRFGAYVDTLQPGPNLRFPRPIEQVAKIDVDRIRNHMYQALMLTQDENIVHVKMEVQYKVKDAAAYLFNVRDPDTTLAEAASSALREVVGKSKMDYVITDGRSDVSTRAQALLQDIADRYRTGLQVVKVNLQDAQPPEEVQGSFADAIKAREDEQRLKNEAEAYANEIIPKARGAAARLAEEANAYRAQVIARAEGDAARFDQLIAEYQKAPEVTRERLYLETMEAVLGKVNKVVVDTKNGNSLMYLPLDKLIQPRGETAVDPLLESTLSVPSMPTETRREAQSRTRVERP